MPRLSGAFLTVDPLAEATLYRTLKRTPGVAGVTLTRAAIRSFRETFRENLMRMILFSLGFSSIIAGAVVYNAARISLSERERDLASMRVLGFNRREIARILFGELALVVLVAIPLGIASGYGLAKLTLILLHNELYRIPLIIRPATYGQAVLGVTVAAVLSAVLVRRRLGPAESRRGTQVPRVEETDMTVRHQRILAWAAAAAVLLIFVVWAFWPRAMPIDVAEVHRDALTVTLDEEGETRGCASASWCPPQSPDARCESSSSRGIRCVPATPSWRSSSRSRPFLLDARGRAEAEARVQAAEADFEGAKHHIASARAELEFAQIERERAQRLAAEEVVSAEALDAAELAERQAAEAAEAAAHAVESASFRLTSERARLLELGSPGRRGDDPIVLRAPIDGSVLRLLHESEGVVRAGEALLELGDATALEVVADFLSSDAVVIQPGARVMIERWGGQQPLEGRVERVEPSGFTKISALGVEEQRVNVIIELTGGEVAQQGLGDGYRVEVRVVVWGGGRRAATAGRQPVSSGRGLGGSTASKTAAPGCGRSRLGRARRHRSKCAKDWSKAIA